MECKITDIKQKDLSDEAICKLVKKCYEEGGKELYELFLTTFRSKLTKPKFELLAERVTEEYCTAYVKELYEAQMLSNVSTGCIFYADAPLDDALAEELGLDKPVYVHTFKKKEVVALAKDVLTLDRWLYDAQIASYRHEKREFESIPTGFETSFTGYAKTQVDKANKRAYDAKGFKAEFLNYSSLNRNEDEAE